MSALEILLHLTVHHGVVRLFPCFERGHLVGYEVLGGEDDDNPSFEIIGDEADLREGLLAELAKEASR